jgi:hypothetical protein
LGRRWVLIEHESKVARRLYNTTEFPDGHTDLALGMNNLAFLYKAKDILAGGEKELIESFKPKINSTKKIEFGKQKYPARQIAGEAFLAEEGISIHLRLTPILADNRHYQVFEFGPKDLPCGKEADKFFESFEIDK